MKTAALTIELVMALGLGALRAQSDKTGELPMAAGPFEPTLQSLANYPCPEWFRDAKFGIWAHWGPQAAPMFGDWYARQMYPQGHPEYKEDPERGVMPGINPNPWQTDTSIGGWFYNRNWKFRPLSWTVQMLNQLADWTAINGEGIYGTRPWLVYGEGPVRAKGGHFGEDFAYSARDIACGLKITGSDLKAVLAPETTVLREVKLVPQGK